MTPALTSRLTSLVRLMLVSFLFAGTMGCKAKPSEKDCKDAINNVRRINGQDSSDMGADPIAMIRSCRGSSSQKSVECMLKAKTQDDLQGCEGEVGGKYFKSEKEATEKRIKESGGADEGDEKPKEELPPEGTPEEAAPSETPPAETPPGEATAPKETAPKEASPKEATPKPKEATPKPKEATPKPKEATPKAVPKATKKGHRDGGP
jgi:hypothetical protein